MTEVKSYCRACMNACPVVAEVQDGQLVSITGDDDNEIFAGYTCIKGRGQPEIMRDPGRILRSLRRVEEGNFEELRVEQLMDEVAEKLVKLRTEYGPRSIAAYMGTYAIMNPITTVFFQSFMRAIGSPMSFRPNTIDKPGKDTSRAMHGSWLGTAQGWDEPDTALLVGLNPFQSYYGTPCGHPGKWLSERLAAGMTLIVIDPRKTDVAKRATIHLQPIPGQDAPLLAAMLNVILTEGLYDRDFVENNTSGIDRLKEVVAAITPEFAAKMADVPVEDIFAAARAFGQARRGYAVSGVGPGFSASSTLIHYLLLDLDAVCGHYLREGEQVKRTVVLRPRMEYKAQALPPRPAYGFGNKMRVMGMSESAAGMPTTALADEILVPGEGQVRALISCGGSPVGAWPDQLKAISALKSLDLLVHFDPWMSPTGRLSHYLVAPKMAYEVPGVTLLTCNTVAAPHWYGPAVPWSQYTPAVVDVPPDSEVIDEYAFFYGVAARMGLQLVLDTATGPYEVDMKVMPDVESLIEVLTRNSRVPLDEVKAYQGGRAYLDPVETVAPKDPGWEGRLELANEDMMADVLALLHDSEALTVDANVTKQGSTFQLISRRMQRSFNSSQNFSVTNRGRGYNPAYMHPDDVAELGIESGCAVRITSERSSIPAVVESDATLRRGLISMTHGFGDGPDRDDEFREIGSSVARLLSNQDIIDRYVGMPRMSGVPVSVEPLVENR